MDVQKSDGFPPEANTACEPSQFLANNSLSDPKSFKKCGFWPAGALTHVEFQVMIMSASREACPGRLLQ